MLRSERKLKHPEEHMPPRLRLKLPSLKNDAVRGEISESYAYSTALCVIYTVEAAVMELRMLCCQRCYVRYVLHTAVSTPAAAQREVRIPVCTELERENCFMKNFRPLFFLDGKYELLDIDTSTPAVRTFPYREQSNTKTSVS